jgi:hypothetical protein
MPISLTPEQVIAQAPDAASAKAGRDLAMLAKWVSAGFDEQAVWGECKGSGKLPYQISIELAEPAFNCSCPSRKFPCKHGLGLLLLYAANQLKAGAPPDFCSEWLAKRSENKERKREKTEAELTPEEIARREKAKIKRTGEREIKVAAGLQELEMWSSDMIRQGLAAAQSHPTEYWEKMSKRLIDAQAPNVARLVRQMSSLVYQKNRYGEKLPEKLLEHLSRIYLICESYRRIGELPEAVQADVKTAVGFTFKEEELQNVEVVEDTWQILGVRVFEEEKLRVQRVWLSGEKSRRRALLLNFAFQNQPLEVGFVAGAKFSAEIAFYPGNFPQRAYVKTRKESQTIETPFGCENFTDFLSDYCDALAKNIWLETFPAMLLNVVPVRRGKFWYLRDRDGELLQIDSDFDAVWNLFAVCGNEPRAIFAEWDGEMLLPLGVWVEGAPAQL